MAKVILDIPTEKMSTFLKLVLQLGISDNAIQSKSNMKPNKKDLLAQISSHLLFDWEFFSNELEFE